MCYTNSNLCICDFRLESTSEQRRDLFVEGGANQRELQSEIPENEQPCEFERPDQMPDRISDWTSGRTSGFVLRNCEVSSTVEVM